MVKITRIKQITQEKLITQLTLFASPAANGLFIYIKINKYLNFKITLWIYHSFLHILHIHSLSCE